MPWVERRGLRGRGFIPVVSAEAAPFGAIKFARSGECAGNGAARPGGVPSHQLLPRQDAGTGATSAILFGGPFGVACDVGHGGKRIGEGLRGVRLFQLKPPRARIDRENAGGGVVAESEEGRQRFVALVRICQKSVGKQRAPAVIGLTLFTCFIQRAKRTGLIRWGSSQ